MISGCSISVSEISPTYRLANVVVVSSAATRALSRCVASGPTFCMNGVSSHPPMLQAMPKLRTNSVGLGSSPP